MDEKELVSRALGGEECAWEWLYRRYAPDIFRFARELHGEAHAEDVMQETFLKAFWKLRKFRGESSFKAWLIAIARNVSNDLWRKTLKRKEKSGEWVETEAVADGPSPAASGEKKELVAAVRDALRRLPDEERDAIALYELQGLSSEEAAGILGWSEGKLRTTAHRARRRLKEILAPAMKED